jgi:adenosylmethionine---8-amino-7-oxononanoate aminotransferase
VEQSWVEQSWVEQSWVDRDAAVVWHGFTQMSCYGENAPIIVDRAEGRELIDVNGRRYFDAISSLWVTTLGHRVPQLDQAIRDQLDKVAHTTMLGNGNRMAIEFAEALAARVPVDGAHVLYASDGASATEQALKMAFQFWTNQRVAGKTSYLTFGDAYHGDTIGALSVGAGGFGTDIFDPLRFPVLRAPSFADPNALDVAAKMVAEHGAHLAAVVVEPYVQGAAGMSIADPSRFAVLGDACRAHDVLLIADEVAVGFGRTGTLFASEQCGIRPDILCLGKGITGGYLPMSVTVASQRVFDAFLGPDLSEFTFYHGHSYGGNALAAAVALRHLQLFDELDVLTNVRARSAQLGARLEPIGRRSTVSAVRLAGLLCGIELHAAPGERRARRVCADMTRRGVLSRSLGDVIILVPPLTTTADEIDLIVDTLTLSLDAVCPE